MEGETKMKSSLKNRVLSSALALTMVAGTAASAFAVETESNRVQKLLKSMSLEQKINQMMMVDFRYWGNTDEEATANGGFTEMNDEVRQIVEEYNFGAIIYFAQNMVGTEQVYQLTQDLQAAATKDNGIPLLIACDQEGGTVYRLATGTALPGNMALGATGNTEYAYAAGNIIGSELSSLGVNTTLAPVVDVNNNANNPVIGLRSYSDNADLVGEMASSVIKGLADNGVIGCAKHFPGHGDTETDSHYGLPSVDKDLETLLGNELKPYEIAIEQGIEMIMTAHILYPQLESDKIVSNKTGEAESLPATMSDDIITGLLKGEMGFEGVVITDAMNMAGIADKWDQVQSVVIAIQAGVDMICMPCVIYCKDDMKAYDAIIDGVVAAVKDGTIPESRIDDAVTRILTVKENRGILDYNAEDYSLEKALEIVGGTENRETERQIAAAAVTVVKNENNVLPLNLDKDSNVLLLPAYNNEIAQLLMGWNRAVEAGIIPLGAEVDYYRISSADNESFTDELAEKLAWADVVIVESETSNLTYTSWTSNVPKMVTEYCKANNVTSVVMSLSKPYDVQLYPDADAILAVYGAKGSSVDPTEALVGGVTGSVEAYGPNIIAGVEVALGTFGAQGTLPVDVPAYEAYTEVDAESGEEVTKYQYNTENIIYERGYGITYDAKTVTEERGWTRADMVMALYELAGKPAVSADSTISFADVDKTDDCYNAVVWAVENGITTGRENGFEPDAYCYKAEVVTFLYRYAGLSEKFFNDVEFGNWYDPYVVWAYVNGIAVADANGNFKPTAHCTAAQANEMLKLYAKNVK